MAMDALKELAAARGLAPELGSEVRLTAKEAMRIASFGPTKFNAEVKAGRLPPPERYGKRCNRWKASTFLAALNGMAK